MTSNHPFPHKGNIFTGLLPGKLGSTRFMGILRQASRESHRVIVGIWCGCLHVWGILGDIFPLSVNLRVPAAASGGGGFRCKDAIFYLRTILLPVDCLKLVSVLIGKESHHHALLVVGSLKSSFHSVQYEESQADPTDSPLCQ